MRSNRTNGVTWIQTASGAQVDLLDPDLSQIHIEDIALALSRLCRYTGHASISVAQHSIMCSQQASTIELQFEALMHDAHEAYIGDVSSPLKYAMRQLFAQPAYLADPFSRVDRRMRRAIARVFDLSPDVPAEIVEIDLRMLQTERLAGFAIRLPWEVSALPYDIEITPMSSAAAYAEFLRTYEALTARRDCE